MPLIRTLPRFTESFLFYFIEFVPDIRSFHAGYKYILSCSRRCSFDQYPPYQLLFITCLNIAIDYRAKNYFTNEIFIFIKTELIVPAVVLTES